tara:strand:- start:752 stop:919 length:168 start_codon:yes stop_codon:yes gene_type:complete
MKGSISKLVDLEYISWGKGVELDGRASKNQNAIGYTPRTLNRKTVPREKEYITAS